MAVPLSQDPALAPAQKAYVLSVAPESATPPQTLIAWLVTLVTVSLTGVLMARSLGGSPPVAAVNVALFESWVMIGLASLCVLLETMIVFALLVGSTEALRERLPEILKDRHRVKGQRVRAWITRANYGVRILALVMGGYVFLPGTLLMLVLAMWLAAVARRHGTIEAIKKVVPDEPVSDAPATNGRAKTTV